METVETLTQKLEEIKTITADGFAGLATKLTEETTQVLDAIAAAEEANPDADLTAVGESVDSLRERLVAGFEAAQQAIGNVIP